MDVDDLNFLKKLSQNVSRHRENFEKAISKYDIEVDDSDEIDLNNLDEEDDDENDDDEDSDLIYKAKNVNNISDSEVLFGEEAEEVSDEEFEELDKLNDINSQLITNYFKNVRTNLSFSSSTPSQSSKAPNEFKRPPILPGISPFVSTNENLKANKENIFISSTPIHPISKKSECVQPSALGSAIKPSISSQNMLNLVRKNNLLDKLNKEIVTSTPINSQQKLAPSKILKSIENQNNNNTNYNQSVLVCKPLQQKHNNDDDTINNENSIIEITSPPIPLEPTQLEKESLNVTPKTSNTALSSNHRLVLVDSAKKLKISDEKSANFTCSYCKNSTNKYPNQKSLATHIRYFHPQACLVACNICSLGFNDENDYNTHMKQHLQDIDDSHPIKNNNNGFNSKAKSELKMTCSYSFSSISSISTQAKLMDLQDLIIPDTQDQRQYQPKQNDNQINISLQPKVVLKKLDIPNNSIIKLTNDNKIVFCKSNEMNNQEESKDKVNEDRNDSSSSTSNTTDKEIDNTKIIKSLEKSEDIKINTSAYQNISIHESKSKMSSNSSIIEELEGEGSENKKANTLPVRFSGKKKLDFSNQTDSADEEKSTRHNESYFDSKKPKKLRLSTEKELQTNNPKNFNESTEQKTNIENKTGPKYVYIENSDDDECDDVEDEIDSKYHDNNNYTNIKKEIIHRSMNISFTVDLDDANQIDINNQTNNFDLTNINAEIIIKESNQKKNHDRDCLNDSSNENSHEKPVPDSNKKFNEQNKQIMNISSDNYRENEKEIQTNNGKISETSPVISTISTKSAVNELSNNVKDIVNINVNNQNEHNLTKDSDDLSEQIKIKKQNKKSNRIEKSDDESDKNDETIIIIKKSEESEYDQKNLDKKNVKDFVKAKKVNIIQSDDEETISKSDQQLTSKKNLEISQIMRKTDENIKSIRIAEEKNLRQTSLRLMNQEKNSNENKDKKTEVDNKKEERKIEKKVSLKLKTTTKTKKNNKKIIESESEAEPEQISQNSKPNSKNEKTNKVIQRLVSSDDEKTEPVKNKLFRKKKASKVKENTTKTSSDKKIKNKNNINDDEIEKEMHKHQLSLLVAVEKMCEPPELKSKMVEYSSDDSDMDGEFDNIKKIIDDKNDKIRKSLESNLIIQNSEQKSSRKSKSKTKKMEKDNQDDQNQRSKKQKSIDQFFQKKNSNKKNIRSKNKKVIDEEDDDLDVIEIKSKKSNLEDKKSLTSKSKLESDNLFKVPSIIPSLTEAASKKPIPVIAAVPSNSANTSHSSSPNINNFFSPDICRKHFLNSSKLKQDLTLSSSRMDSMLAHDTTSGSTMSSTFATPNSSINNKRRIVMKMNSSQSTPNMNNGCMSVEKNKPVDFISEILKKSFHQKSINK